MPGSGESVPIPGQALSIALSGGGSQVHGGIFFEVHHLASTLVKAFIWFRFHGEGRLPGAQKPR